MSEIRLNAYHIMWLFVFLICRPAPNWKEETQHCSAKQYGEIKNYYGKIERRNLNIPQQLELF